MTEELLYKRIIKDYLTEQLQKTTFTNSTNPKETYWKRHTLKQLLKELTTNIKGESIS